MEVCNGVAEIGVERTAVDVKFLYYTLQPYAYCAI